jgi:hypothetical protein
MAIGKIPGGKQKVPQSHPKTARHARAEPPGIARSTTSYLRELHALGGWSLSQLGSESVSVEGIRGLDVVVCLLFLINSLEVISLCVYLRSVSNSHVNQTGFLGALVLFSTTSPANQAVLVFLSHAGLWYFAPKTALIYLLEVEACMEIEMKKLSRDTQRAEHENLYRDTQRAEHENLYRDTQRAEHGNLYMLYRDTQREPSTIIYTCYIATPREPSTIICGTAVENTSASRLDPLLSR